MKLHLGCGSRYIPGWFHVDGCKFPHVDLVTELNDLSALSSSTASIIYASHVLEHFPRSDLLDLLHEWKRLLVPGGCIRLAVPDFAALSNLYQKTGDIQMIKGPICGGQDHKYNFHFNIFDKESLFDQLLSAGFNDPEVWDWRMTEHSHIDDFSQAYIPHMAKSTGTLISLNVQAFKPSL